MWVTDPFSHVIYPDIVQLWHVLEWARMQSHHHSYLSARRKCIIKAGVYLSHMYIRVCKILHGATKLSGRDRVPWVSLAPVRWRVTSGRHYFYNLFLISHFYMRLMHTHVAEVLCRYCFGIIVLSACKCHSERFNKVQIMKDEISNNNEVMEYRLTVSKGSGLIKSLN